MIIPYEPRRGMGHLHNQPKEKCKDEEDIRYSPAKETYQNSTPKNQKG
jgi:hypothetical protein